MLLAWGCIAAAQPDDPSLGTWKLNREKSAGIRLQSLTLTVERAGNGLRNTAVGINSTGAPVRIQYTAYYDGQDWPVTGYSISNSASFRRIDARTSERTDKLNGRIVQTSLRVIAEDGRSMMVTLKPSGAVLFYDRQ